MNVFDRFPINKTAALVTNQKGCASKSEREKLIGNKKKEAKIWKNKLISKLRKVNQKIKDLNIRESRSSDKFLIEELKNILSREDYENAVKRANARHKLHLETLEK